MATKARSGGGFESSIRAKPQPWRTIVGVVPDTLMQGPFNQQTDTAGFYMPLLGARPAPQFCTIVVRPRPGQRADTLGPALSKAVAQLDPNLPTYFAGTPARVAQRDSRGESNHRDALHHLRRRSPSYSQPSAFTA